MIKNRKFDICLQFLPAIALAAGLIISAPVFFGGAEAQETLPSGLNRDFDSSGFLSDIIVKDPFTGLALGGIDPLSYFIDGRAGSGRAGK